MRNGKFVQGLMKYHMLNAAVPMEAYDENAHNDLMLDGAWKTIDERFRASHFSDQFINQTFDFRFGLSWKGRFAGIHDVVNCGRICVFRRKHVLRHASAFHARNKETPFHG